jgi:hypothetical protein
MKVVISAWLWLLISVVCPAAEIVAWKVPLEAYLYDGLKSEGVVRLESPPEPSPFFGPADELWDLGKVPMEKRDRSFFVPSRLAAQPPMEWAVWNASTRRLVTKGGWNSVWQLHRELGIEQLPQMCRITLEVFEMKADGTPPNDKSIPISQLAWLSRSGAASEAVSPVRGHRIRAKVEATISDDSSVVDLRLNTVCRIPDQPEIVIETALSLDPEKRMWIARDADGEKGFDLTITVQIVLPDGSPFHERMMIQKGAESRPINPYRGSFKRHQANGGQWLAVNGTSIDMIKSLEAEEEVDPFAELDPNAPPFVMAELKLDELDFPRELLGWVGGPVWDLRDAMIQNAVMTQDSPSVAGFNPELMILFLLSKDAVELDRFEQLFGWSRGVASNIAVSLEAGTQTTRVVCHSGQVVKLERCLDGEDSIRFLEAESVISDDRQLIDLHFVYRDGPSEEPHRSCDVRLTVDARTPVEVMAHRIAGESLPPLMAKAEGVGPSGEVEEVKPED